MNMPTTLPLMILLFVLSMAFPSFSESAESDGAADVKKSWDSAVVYLPGQRGTTVPAKIDIKERRSVVIYLHGCAGYNFESSSWGDYLAGLGYITLLPDSMARRTEMNCDPVTKKSGRFPKAHAMRQEEIAYALDRVRESPWADPENVFLMGFSEGGVAAARTRLEGFSGIIISGWRCTNTKYPGFDGISAPLTTPVLTLEYTRDDWQTDTTKGSCSDKFGDRKKASQLLLPGSGHGVFDQAAAREAVAKFLKENLKPR